MPQTKQCSNTPTTSNGILHNLYHAHTCYDSGKKLNELKDSGMAELHNTHYWFLTAHVTILNDTMSNCQLQVSSLNTHYALLGAVCELPKKSRGNFAIGGPKGQRLRPERPILGVRFLRSYGGGC